MGSRRWVALLATLMPVLIVSRLEVAGCMACIGLAPRLPPDPAIETHAARSEAWLLEADQDGAMRDERVRHAATPSAEP
jgi:hypothetical protein